MFSIEHARQHNIGASRSTMSSGNSHEDLTGQPNDPLNDEEQTGRTSPSIRRTCAICLEQIASDRQFGILENCDHIFCHRCIRQWRQSSQHNRLKCPQCRTLSHVMISSSRWFTCAEDKREMFTEKLNEMAAKPCGAGICRYGDECRFLHEIDPNVEPVNWELVSAHLDSFHDGDSTEWPYEYRNTFGEEMVPQSDAEESSIFSSSDDVHSSAFDISSGVPDCLHSNEQYWSGYMDDMFIQIDSDNPVENVDSNESQQSNEEDDEEDNLFDEYESDQEIGTLHAAGRVDRLEISLGSSDDEPMDASVQGCNRSFNARNCVIEQSPRQFYEHAEDTDDDMSFDEDDESSCTQNVSSSCSDEYISSCYESPDPSDLEEDWQENYNSYRNEPPRSSGKSQTSSYSDSDHESVSGTSANQAFSGSHSGEDSECPSSEESVDSDESYNSQMRNSESSYVSTPGGFALTASVPSDQNDRVRQMMEVYRNFMLHGNGWPQSTDADWGTPSVASEASRRSSNEDDEFDDHMVDGVDSYSDEDAFSYENDYDDDYEENASSASESSERSSPPAELSNENRLNELVVRLSILGCPSENNENERGHDTTLRRKGRR